MALIGLDIGTTGCKAHIFDDELHLLGSASREYAVDIRSDVQDLVIGQLLDCVDVLLLREPAVHRLFSGRRDG